MYVYVYVGMISTTLSLIYGSVHDNCNKSTESSESKENAFGFGLEQSKSIFK